MKKLFLFGTALAAALSASAELCVKKGDSVAFMGDSITQFGNQPAGYVNLVMKGLEVAGVRNVKKIPAGVSGHKSVQMSERLGRDVLARRDGARATYMTFSCGVNDVWHGKNGVPIEKYRELVAGIFDRCAAANVQVIVLTATMIGEDANNDNNRKLVAYNEFLRAEAKRRGLRLADLNADMQAELAEIRKTDKTGGNKLTCDGVHMAFPGNCLMAWGVLKAMGIDPALRDRVYAAWRKMPGAHSFKVEISADDWPVVQKRFQLAGDANAWINDVLVKGPQPQLHGDKQTKLRWAERRTSARQYKAANGLTLNYRWHEPAAKAGKCPLLVFLHGAGERGGDNSVQMIHGVPELINYALRKDKPFFLLAPQCPGSACPGDPQGTKWTQLKWDDAGVQTMPAQPSVPMTALIELLEKKLKDPRIDTSRVYVTGVSMGGYGSWDLACRRPQWFAAVMPLCGGCDEKAALVLKGTPVRIVHGLNDTCVPPVRGLRACEALKAAGGNVGIVTYPGVGHNCWDRTYGDDAMLDWLFAQRR